MFDQMKQMVYDQTEQNVMEKKKLVNTLLDNYNQATIKFLYYTDEVQEYLNTRQSVLSVEEQEKLTDMISYQIGSVSYTHLRAHETPEHLVCRLLLEKIFLMIRRPPRSTRVRSSAASDVYKRQKCLRMNFGS